MTLMGLARIIAGVLIFGACGGGSPEAPWTVVAKDQPSALLSVWGSSDSDVWVVGGEPTDHSGPIVEHYDGTTWTKLDTTQRNIDLWWVKGFDGGPVFVSGTNGTILEYQNGQFTKLTTPPDGVGMTVFGMWGATANDLYAVGGQPDGGGGAFIWHWDGSMWSDVGTGIVPTDGTCWKTNGRSASDFWVVCTNGMAFHYDGSTFDEQDYTVAMQEGASLLSVACTTKTCIAVGGAFDGVLAENDGSGWKQALPSGGPILNGVGADDTDAYAVGQFGTVLARGSNGKWASQKSGTDQHLHAVWIDPSGGVWAVGGNFDVTPYSAGTVIHKGDALKGSFQ
jgi:hypothetical protein